MSDGDFGGDDGGSDGGPFDLNKNGSSLDEFVIFAAITESNRAQRTPGGGPAKKSGCLLPVVVIVALVLALLAI